MPVVFKVTAFSAVPLRSRYREDTHPMTADLLAALPLAVLAVHVDLIASNVFGLIAISLAHALGNESHKILRRITPSSWPPSYCG